MLGSALAWLSLSWILHGLHRATNFRLITFILFYDPNSFILISSSWIKISLHTEFQFPSLPGSRNASFRLNPFFGGLGGRVVKKIRNIFPQWEWSLIPFYGIIRGTKKNFKLLGYHLRVPQAPLFRPKNTKDFHRL